MSKLPNSIKPLTLGERTAIKQALEFYVRSHSDRESWAQNIVLNEMLDSLMWADFGEKG